LGESHETHKRNVRREYGVLEIETYCRILRGSESNKICAFKDANKFEVPVS
jgi:hypothetical protein